MHLVFSSGRVALASLAVATGAIALALTGCGTKQGTGSGGAGTTSANASGAVTGTGTTGANGSGSTSTGGAVGSGTTSTGTGGVACTITLSGAVNKTVPCTVHAGYDASKMEGGVPIISTTTIGGAPEAVYGVKVASELMPQTYDWSNSVQNGAAVYEGGANGWTADKSKGTGSSSITLSNVTTTIMSGTMKVYDVHGSVTAMLVPAQGASGTVKMSITF